MSSILKKSFKDFLNEDELEEELHPELTAIIKSSTASNKSKQKLLIDKIKDLMARGEKTGIEGNMPKGSSRAYMKHDTPYDAVVDGKDTKLPTGMKVAIRSNLHKYHVCSQFDGYCLGALQNKAENEDYWVNNNYRILTKNTDKGPNQYDSNKEGGIFPPLFDHDSEGYKWTHVSHIRNIKPGEFNKLTITPEFPKGISHQQFVDVLMRFHNKNNGQYWKDSQKDPILDKIEQHPLIQKFQDYHGNTGNPPTDYGQLKNLGVFEHPDGSLHIVARDHGFNTEVADAYSKAFQSKFNRR